MRVGGSGDSFAVLIRAMAYSIDILPVLKARADGLYEVAEKWSVTADVGGGRLVTVQIGEGFTTDGASIPRALWRLCGHPFETPRVVAALAHDWLYASHATDRKTADMVFRALCVLVGVGKVRAAVEYRALRLFGWAAWRSHGAEDNAAARELGCVRVEDAE